MPSGKGPDDRAAFGKIKDSGKRQQFESGMQRDVTENKLKPHLCFDGPMFMRWAKHLTAGAEKYDDRNWLKANGQAELDRFLESAVRHFISYIMGETDEDHAAALYFNINGAEYVRNKLGQEERATGNQLWNYERGCWPWEITENDA